METLVRLSAVLDNRDPLRTSPVTAVWDLIPYDFSAVQRSYDEWVASLGGVRLAPVPQSLVDVVGPADDVDENHILMDGGLGPNEGCVE